MRQRLSCLAIAALALSVLAAPACRSSKTSQSNGDSSQPKAESEAAGESGASATESSEKPDPEWAKETVCEEDQSVATFAGGCFWCMEPPYDNLNGVQKTIVGYAGGTTPNPTYSEVAGGQTDHAETIQICYDDSTVSYETLLKVFWRRINPTQEDGQFVDIGSQYRTVIFYHDESQKQAAKSSKKDLAENGPFDDPIVTDIEPYTGFWKASEKHQAYYKKNPEDYHAYHDNSGRYPFYKEHWGAKNPTKDVTAEGGK